MKIITDKYERKIMKKYIIKQQDENDCGACSLQSIIVYYKGYIPLEVIKIDTNTDTNGTNFFYLKQAGEKYGFDVTGKHIDKIDNLILPCIAQLSIDGYNHFVTIYKVSNKITYMDPSKGIVIEELSDFFDKFTGKILEFIPVSKIIKYQKNKAFENLLKIIYKKNQKTILVLIALLFVTTILSLISNFNLLLIKNNKLIYVVFIVIISKIIINYIKNMITTHLNKKINTNLLKTYIKYIFDLPLKYLQLKKPGDFISRIEDLNNIKDFFSNVIIESVLNILFFFTSIIILFFLNYKLTLIIIIIVIIYTLVLSLLNKELYQKIVNVIESDNQFINTLIEYLNKINTIKILKNNYFLKHLNIKIDVNLLEKLMLDKKLFKLELIKNFFEELMYILILLSFSILKHDYLILIIYLNVYNYFIQSIKYFIDLIPTYFYFKEASNRIKSIFDLDITNKTNINITFQKIIIKNLYYSFNNINNIFENFNIKINSKDKVLLQGVNGSGKSTLLGLITGVYSDYKGKIYAPENISYVQQNSQLFSDTILNNILLGEEYKKEKFELIKNLVLLDEIIINKPNGYNTMLNSTINLSGGEQQKIIIARAIYKNFDVLILDESLSEISAKVRKQILLNLFKYYEDKIIIYVSHHNENIKFNQKIYLTARKEYKC